MLIPKSYKIRHTILQTLADKRSEQQLNGLSDENSQLTIEELSKITRYNRNLIDQQLNVLWESKDVIDISINTKPIDHSKTKYMISSKGISIASSKSILNDGKLINSQLYNNYASAIFQIFTGIIALMTIIISFTTVSELKSENLNIKKNTLLIQDRLFKLETDLKIKNIKADTKSLQNVNTIKLDTLVN